MVKRQIVHLQCLHCCSGLVKEKNNNLHSNHKHLQARKVSVFEVQYKSELRLFFLLLGLFPSYLEFKIHCHLLNCSLNVSFRLIITMIVE